ncbi:MAG TPA: hypothetical protein VII59_15875 [Streptosporangiaceae bacterium]
MTQPPEPSRGIVISGGTVHIGALAQGPGARASQVVSQPAAEPDSGAQREELAGLMRELLAAIGDHTGELADEAGAQTAAEEAAAELGEDRPDVSRVRQLLSKLAIDAGPVSEIAAAIITVERAIAGLL